MNKLKLRQDIKEKLNQISGADFLQKSELISANLLELISKLNSKKSSGCTIGCFCPIQREPMWYLNFPNTYKYAAVHMHSERKLSYYTSSLDEIKSGELGLELTNLKGEIVPDILLIPGVGFTKNGERLGRGRGYFDSYLMNFKGVKIGVSFECQIEDDICNEAHDERVNFVVTERNIYTVR